MSLAERTSDSLKDDIASRQITKPVVLNSVSVTGGDLSKDYLEQLVDPALNEKPKLSFGELRDRLGNIEKTLLYTGLFQDVRIKLDLDAASGTTGTGPVPVKAAVKLTEIPLFKYSCFSRSTDHDVAAGFRYVHPNFTQQADTLLVDINLNYDPFGKSLNHKVWDLTYLRPLHKSVTGRVVLNPTIASVDASQWAGHQQHAVGAFLGFQTAQILERSTSVLTAGVSSTLRQVTDISNAACDQIRTYAGGDMKLGASANWKLDTREYTGKFATSGVLIDASGELAGHNSVDQHTFSQPGSSTSANQIELLPFSKVVLSIAAATSFFGDALTAAVDAQAGALCSLSNQSGASDRLHVADRLFLGGINSLRGFHTHAVGLQEGNDHIGGLSAAKLGLSLFARVPGTTKDSPLRIFGFVNGGDVRGSIEEGIQAIKNGDVAAAAGVGLSYTADAATLDLSYNTPLTHRPQDTAKNGLSLSVALNFK